MISHSHLQCQNKSLEITHLPKSEVCGIEFFEITATLFFDFLFQLSDKSIDWYLDIERGFVSIDEAAKSVRIRSHFGWV